MLGDKIEASSIHDATTNVHDSLIKPQQRRLHDPDVTFEEYHWYAQRTRIAEAENADSALPSQKARLQQLLTRRKHYDEANVDGSPPKHRRKASLDINLSKRENRLEVTDEEWVNASRMLRNASWGACFYLITTDILGPYGVGFAMGTLGWGPGIALYTVFGLMAGYSGYLLWYTFLGLDSYEFPLLNYGDLAYRIYGPTVRHIVNVLQGILLLLILGQVIILLAQAVSQVSRFQLCYVVCGIIIVVVGYFLGQVRTLRNYGWLANAAIWLNLLVIFISMGVMAHSPPNYAISVLGSAGAAVDPSTVTPDPATGEYPPVRHYNGMPNTSNFVGAINGLMQGVFAYGGAQLFIEFMAEMKRPRDFIKAMWGAQFFIYSVYLIYGCYVYYFQGQYSFQPSYQGVSIYAWQTVGNILAILSGIIAAGLYGNIGIKVFYANILIDLFSFPPLTTHKGKIYWAIIVPLWWTIAFIIAAAIPDYFGFVSVISASTVIQFTYSFPPILALGYNIQHNAMLRDQSEFDPSTGRTNRKTTGIRRLVLGFTGPTMTGKWWVNLSHVLYAVGALATAGLGMYAAIEGLIAAFENDQANAFSCRSPLDLSS